MEKELISKLREILAYLDEHERRMPAIYIGMALDLLEKQTAKEDMIVVK